MAYFRIFVFVSVVFVLSFTKSDQRSVTLEERLASLEKQVFISALKNIENGERIQKLETRKSIGQENQSANGGSGVAGDVEKKLDELEQRTETFMEDITEMVVALPKGLSDEKVVNHGKFRRQDADIKAMTERMESMDKQNAKTFQISQELSSRLLKTVNQLNNTIFDTLSNLSQEKKQSCPQHWFQIREKCLLYVNQSTDWLSAIRECKAHDAILVEPRDVETMTEMKKYVPLVYIWTGGNDREKEGEWVWNGSGEKVSSIKWMEGQPNSHNGDQDCLELRLTDGKYNDEGCTVKNQYVCEN